jgi:hypothetical protein
MQEGVRCDAQLCKQQGMQSKRWVPWRMQHAKRTSYPSRTLGCGKGNVCICTRGKLLWTAPLQDVARRALCCNSDSGGCSKDSDGSIRFHQLAGWCPSCCKAKGAASAAVPATGQHCCTTSSTTAGWGQVHLSGAICAGLGGTAITAGWAGGTATVTACRPLRRFFPPRFFSCLSRFW